MIELHLTCYFSGWFYNKNTPTSISHYQGSASSTELRPGEEVAEMHWGLEVSENGKFYAKQRAPMMVPEPNNGDTYMYVVSV